MLILGSRLHHTPVMSLQTGTKLAHVTSPIIDPATLKIVAYVLEGPLLAEHPSYLRVDDIREIGNIGIIVDSSDEFVGLEDVIKLKELIKLNFPLIGMSVIDEHKRKLGKVENYTLESGSFVIQQLEVKRGILKGITDAGLLIHRSQITKITDQAIVVKSSAKKQSAEPVMEATRGEFVNPFRTPKAQPEQTDI